MPYHVKPLRYAIDDWHQLPQARSNLDPSLRVRVSDFVQSEILQGTRVEVVHPQYGILFAGLSNANGRLVDADFQLATEDILTALRQLGFDVFFKTNIKVEPDTLAFLESCKTAGYTHIRRVPFCKYSPAISKVITKHIIICFNENTHPELVEQYIKPLVRLDGDIMRVSPNNNPNLDFSWLSDMPMHIESIITDNIKE